MEPSGLAGACWSAVDFICYFKIYTLMNIKQNVQNCFRNERDKCMIE